MAQPFHLRGFASLCASDPAPEGGGVLRRSLRAKCFSEDTVPGKNDFRLFRACGRETLPRAFCGWGRKFFVALGGGMFYNVSIIGAGGNCDG